MAFHVNTSNTTRPTAGNTAHTISIASRLRGALAVGSGTWRVPRTERMMKNWAIAQHTTDVQNSPSVRRKRMCWKWAREARKLTVRGAWVNGGKPDNPLTHSLHTT